MSKIKPSKKKVNSQITDEFFERIASSRDNPILITSDVLEEHIRRTGGEVPFEGNYRVISTHKDIRKGILGMHHDNRENPITLAQVRLIRLSLDGFLTEPGLARERLKELVLQPWDEDPHIFSSIWDIYPDFLSLSSVHIAVSENKRRSLHGKTRQNGKKQKDGLKSLLHPEREDLN